MESPSRFCASWVGGADGMIVFLKQGNHVSVRRCVDSDANSDEELNSDANSDAPLNFDAELKFRCKFR